MKLRNKTKSRFLTYKLLTYKYIVMFIGIQFVINSSLLAGNTQTSILKQIKVTIQNQSPKDPLLQNIDSMIETKQITEYGFRLIIDRTGDLFREQGKLIDAVELFQKVVSYYEQKNNPNDEEIKALIHFLIPLGASLEELGLWNNAMNYYLKALSLSEKHGIEDNNAMIYNNIGVIYYNQKEFKKAESYILKSLKINKENNNKKEIFNNINNLGGIYLHTNSEDRALDYALQAIQLLDKEKDAYLYYFMQSNIASIYLIKGEYALASSYARNAIIHQQKYGFHSDLMQTYNLLSEIFERMDEKDSSYVYLNKVLSEAQSLRNRQMESEVQQKLAEMYYEKKDLNKAYKALKVSTTLKDSLYTANNNKKIDDIERIYHAEKKMQENELLIKDITLQKIVSNRLWIIMITLTSFFILVIIFLIYFFKIKEKQRRNKELLDRQQTALLEKEKELQFQKEKELHSIIDQRNRELTSYTLYRMKTNEFISDINDELKQLLLQLNPRDREHKAQIQRMQMKLQRQDSTNNWDEFRYYFELVHPSFYKDLEKVYPDLTIKEKHLCAFIRLGLSSKEIAAITFKEVRSVETARNRLRRKLDINPEEELADFLSKY